MSKVKRRKNKIKNRKLSVFLSKLEFLICLMFRKTDETKKKEHSINLPNIIQKNKKTGTLCYKQRVLEILTCFRGLSCQTTA